MTDSLPIACRAVRWSTTPRLLPWGARPTGVRGRQQGSQPCRHMLAAQLVTPPLLLGILAVWHRLDRRFAGSLALSHLALSLTLPHWQLPGNPLDWRKWFPTLRFLAVHPASPRTRVPLSVTLKLIVYNPFYVMMRGWRSHAILASCWMCDTVLVLTVQSFAPKAV